MTCLAGLKKEMTESKLGEEAEGQGKGGNGEQWTPTYWRDTALKKKKILKYIRQKTYFCHGKVCRLTYLRKYGTLQIY